MRKEFKILVMVLLVLRVIIWMTGCKQAEEDTLNVDRYKALEETEEAFLVFFDPSAYMLLQSFKENHPNIEIEMVQLDYFADDKYSALKEMIEKYGAPDLILGRNRQMHYSSVVDLDDLNYCYEMGYFADLSTFIANDANLDINAYFPGTFEVFRNKEHLYAVPLGISMDFMVTSESKYNGSDFADLEDEYTGRELLDVWLSEMSKEREPDEFFCPQYFSEAGLLYQLGGITQTAGEIQVDEEIFRKLYEFGYLHQKHVDETKSVWDQSGKQFNADTGYVNHTAFEPRKYEGKFTVSLWSSMDAPAFALSYATTANQYHLDEGTKAIYFPNINDGNAYTAQVEVYGAVGAESRRIELAYELLRLLMDEEISYFQIVSGFPFGGMTTDPKNTGLNFYPVNKEVAMGLLDEFEQRNAQLFYEQLGSGRFLQMLDIVEVSAEEKEKHEKMLNGISGMYSWNENISKISEIISGYQSVDIKDYKACYDEVMMILNEDKNALNINAAEDILNVSDSEIEESSEADRGENDDANEMKEEIRNTEIGGTFFFGETEQDNNLDNGAEPIEWIVLEKTEDKAFVISKKVIEWLTFSKYDDMEVEYGENGAVISASGSPMISLGILNSINSESG